MEEAVATIHLDLMLARRERQPLGQASGTAP